MRAQNPQVVHVEMVPVFLHASGLRCKNTIHRFGFLLSLDEETFDVNLYSHRSNSRALKESGTPNHHLISGLVLTKSKQTIKTAVRTKSLVES
jgi:hypothetical protein